MIVLCPALTSTRVKFWFDRSVATPALYRFIIIWSTPQAQTQFILDPIQEMLNTLGKDIINYVYYLTRTFAYCMHSAKIISLGRWPGVPDRKPKSSSKIKTLPPAHHTVCVSDPKMYHYHLFPIATPTLSHSD